MGYDILILLGYEWYDISSRLYAFWIFLVSENCIYHIPPKKYIRTKDNKPVELGAQVLRQTHMKETTYEQE